MKNLVVCRLPPVFWENVGMAILKKQNNFPSWSAWKFNFINEHFMINLAIKIINDSNEKINNKYLVKWKPFSYFTNTIPRIRTEGVKPTLTLTLSQQPESDTGRTDFKLNDIQFCL